MNFKEQNGEYLAYIEEYLDEQCFQYESEPQKELFEAMRYSLLAGGKRLRPIFVFDFCRMCGGDWKAAAPFAAAVEMVHTYSLIHDDLPCMDNDDYRRGRLTNHKVYGEATAVLAGDALLTAAFSYLAKAPFSAETRIRAVEILSNCAGELGMVGGQVLDMHSEERQCTEQEVLDIQSRKTGALIRAACMLGVLAAGGDGEQLSAAGDFASHLGLAFQIRDDMLDVIGNAEEMGKAVGTDAVKNTFVQLYGLNTCDELVRKHTQQAIAHLSHFQHTQFMESLANHLTSRTV
ncbi:MAG: polyprenyl synthetase family protein [Oscillospiraceae bacterium]|nr:polyprenyl synthetase family protein [Oscillospiraceae bacterium]